jgi:hypothetical protein
MCTKWCVLNPIEVSWVRLVAFDKRKSLNLNPDLLRRMAVSLDTLFVGLQKGYSIN